MITVLCSNLDDNSDVEKRSVGEVIEALIRISDNTISKECGSDHLGLIYNTHIRSNSLINIRSNECKISNRVDLFSLILPQRIQQLATMKNMRRKNNG